MRLRNCRLRRCRTPRQITLGVKQALIALNPVVSALASSVAALGTTRLRAGFDRHEFRYNLGVDSKYRRDLAGQLHHFKHHAGDGGIGIIPGKLRQRRHHAHRSAGPE